MVSSWTGGNQNVISGTFVNVTAQLLAVVIYGAFIQQKHHPKIRL
jgi:hypothetical protein